LRNYPIIEFNSEPESITKNQYIVELTFSHGDADFETKDCIDFDKLNDASLFIYLCKKLQEIINYKRAYGIKRSSITKCILENTNWTLQEDYYGFTFKDGGFDTELTYLFNELDFWAWDKSYPDILASLYKIEVFYYDSQGLKFRGKV